MRCIGFSGQAAGFAGSGAEEGGLAGIADPGRVEIFIEEVLELVMKGSEAEGRATVPCVASTVRYSSR